VYNYRVIIFEMLGMTEKVNTENIYELWYLWLDTTDPMTWTPFMQEGLVDCKVPFDEWWEDCKHYFLPACDTTPLWVINNEHDYANHHEEGDPENELIIALNVGLPAKTLLNAVKKLLDERGLTFPVGKPKFDDSAADVFELYKRPDGPTIQVLNKMLNVYNQWCIEQQKKKRGEKYKALWEIGVDQKVNLEQVPQDGDTKKTQGMKRRILTATVSRYLKWSDTLRKNIILGSKHFPKYR